MADLPLIPIPFESYPLGAAVQVRSTRHDGRQTWQQWISGEVILHDGAAVTVELSTGRKRRLEDAADLRPMPDRPASIEEAAAC